MRHYKLLLLKLLLILLIFQVTLRIGKRLLLSCLFILPFDNLSGIVSISILAASIHIIRKKQHGECRLGLTAHTLLVKKLRGTG